MLANQTSVCATWLYFACANATPIRRAAPAEATSTIACQTPVVKNPLGLDVWLRAIEFSPKNRQVVHHILSGKITLGRKQSLIGTTSLGVYIPGDVPLPLPDITGVFVPKDENFYFQIRYIANGKAMSVEDDVRSQPRCAVFLQRSRRSIHSRPLCSYLRLCIPPNTNDDTARTNMIFQRDALVCSRMPHSHFRGRAAQFTAYCADGRNKVLLAVARRRLRPADHL